MNQLISMVENGVTTNFTYDANGNMTQKTKGIEWWKYYYDYENRLTKVEYFDGTQTLTLGQYYYDGDGKRIKKQENGETVVYIYSGIQVIYEKVIESGKETKYIGRVAKIERINGTEMTTFFHTDHLGSTRAVTDSVGNLTATLQYDPFGEVRSGSSNGIRYTYTGKEQDATGLYYYGARFYDPKVGRFITKDTFPGRAGSPQTQNRYSYVINNPLKFIDPTGNWSLDYRSYSVSGKSGRTISFWNASTQSRETIQYTDNPETDYQNLQNLRFELILLGYDPGIITSRNRSITEIEYYILIENFQGSEVSVEITLTGLENVKTIWGGKTIQKSQGSLIEIQIQRWIFGTGNPNDIRHVLKHEMIHAELFASGEFWNRKKEYGSWDQALAWSEAQAYAWNILNEWKYPSTIGIDNWIYWYNYYTVRYPAIPPLS